MTRVETKSLISSERYSEIRSALDADSLIRTAKEKSGLSDFGDQPFYPALCKLIDCAARDVDFHALGIQAFKNDIVRHLINRLRMQNDINDHPEILDEDVSDPIIILGLGRSGTTKLHKMLSAPDSVQKTLFWRIWNPARFPDAIPGKPDPRIAAAGSSNILSAENPVLDAAHHVEQQEVEEEWLLYMSTFDDWSWVQVLPSPSYFDWVMSRPSIEVFRYVKTILQYLQWQDGGRGGKNGDRPWVLKAVGYIANMDSLLACYPNATLVHAHRDPLDTIPSYSKMVSGLWPLYANPVAPKFLGTEMLRTWSTAMERYVEARERLRLNDRILDVKYEQIRSDPMTAIRAIYQRTGRTLSWEAEHKMTDWHNQNEQGRYGKHDYSLDEFGLNQAAIRNAFAGYLNKFSNGK